MQKPLIAAALLAATLLVSCSDSAAPIEDMPPQAWSDPVIEVSNKGKVVVDILERGTGTEAHEGDLVSIHYTGWVRNSKVAFDSSAFGAPLSFRLGDKQMIAGVEQGVTGLTVGSRARLHIPWKLGYGEAGRKGVIPGKADLVFDIELISVK